MEIKGLFVLVVIVLLSASCAQLTPFHSARTEGAGNLTITPTVDASVIASSATSALGTQVFPGVRAELAYGIVESLDIIASLNSSGAFKASVKFQFYGDNYSNIALAAMPGYEYQANLFNQGENVSIQRIHLPIIASISASENIDFYLGPDVVYQFEKNADKTIFPGVNLGIEIGSRIKYNIGVGAYLPNTFDGSNNGQLYQFGGSVRIPLN